MDSYSFYRMQNNTFLGECLSIVYKPTPQEIETDCLQTSYILLLLKTNYAFAELHNLDDLRTARLFDEELPILLRVASECQFGTFGDSHCDCEPQRIASMRAIQAAGQGIYVHIPQEAQGNGLFYKAQELQIQVSGIAPNGSLIGQKTVEEASEYLLGSDQILDKRSYTALSRIFQETSLNRYSYKIISDSPSKIEYFQNALKIDISGSHSVKRAITVDNAGEFLSKLYIKNYQISNDELEKIYLALFEAEKIPHRVSGLLRSIDEDINVGREFQADINLLQKIVGIGKARGQKSEQSNEFVLMKDVSTYEEYQVELKLSTEDVKILFEKDVLRGIVSLRYEENHFYDMVSFESVPSRSLKIRNAFRLTERQTPEECKFIYKIPVDNKLYKMKALTVKDYDIVKLLDFALRDYQQHMLPVFTHNVIGPDNGITLLIKRYTNTLRTLSLNGPKANVQKLISIIKDYVPAEEIDDPSNSLFINRKLSVDFDYDELAKEELALYRSYSVG